MLLLAKLQAKAFSGSGFPRFLNSTNDRKLHNASHLLKNNRRSFIPQVLAHPKNYLPKSKRNGQMCNK